MDLPFVEPTMKVAEFFVEGRPAPGGSKTAIPVRRGDGTLVMTRTTTGKIRPVLRYIDDAKGNAGWKKIVQHYAKRQFVGVPPVTCPLIMEIVFHVKRPKFHFGTGRNSQVLKQSAPSYPAVKPDLTKLVRSTEDAMKGIVYEDDAQIIRQTVSKVYSNVEGAAIRFTEAP